MQLILERKKQLGVSTSAVSLFDLLMLLGLKKTASCGLNRVQRTKSMLFCITFMHHLAEKFSRDIDF